MSYATDVLRRRQEAEAAWQKRYNPLEGIGQQILDIDKEMQAQKAGEEKRKQEAELFGLKKTESEALTEKYRAEATRGNEERLALAEKRKAEAAAAAAEERRKAEAAALSGGARDVYGRLLAGGQTTKSILEASQAAARAEQMRASREKHSQQLADAMARGDSAEVGRLRQQIDEETKAVLGEKKVTAGGLTEDDVKEMADAHGVSYGAMLAEIQKMEAEDAASREKMGLTTQQTETERARQEQLRAAADAAKALEALRGRQGYPKPEKPVDAALEDAKRRKQMAEAARAEAKLARDEQIAKAGGFAVTKEVGDILKKRREAMANRKVESARIRELIKKYPDMETYVGPLDQYVSNLRAMGGDAKASEIIKTLGSAFDNYRMAVTGAAAGPNELKILEKRVPNMGDSLGGILGKLNGDDEYFDLQFRVVDAQLASGDLRAADTILGIKSSTSPTAGASAAPASEKLKEQATRLKIKLE